MNDSSPHLETEVLIVGAGPAGLACAIGLAMRGIDFVIVDALPEAQNTSRAAVIHAATLDALDRIGVADTLIAQGLQVTHFQVRDRDEVLFHADFSALPGRRSFALMIPQDESERVLVDRLQELGHAVRRRTRLLRLVRDNQVVHAECVDASGPLVVRAKLVIGADGEKSTVREQTGIGFPGVTYGSFLLADVRMQWPIERSGVSLFFSPEGPLVVAPMSRERYRVVAQLPEAPASPTVPDVQRLLDARGPRRNVAVREVLWGSRFRVHHRIADRFREGPVVLAGDAAHVHSPAGGQGMNLGIRDARSLSEAVTDVLRKNDEARLDAYAAQRRRSAKAVLRMTARLTRVATLPNARLRAVRNRLIAMAGRLPVVRRRVALALAGFGR